MEDVISKEEPPKKKKSLWRVIIEWLIYLALLAGLVWGTPIALAKILKTQYPIASITSGSMWPTLKEGDLVLIRGVSGKNEIKVGDIVVYHNPSTSSGQVQFTIHRVVRLNENNFVTKGDANNVDDTAVAYDRLVGKTVNWGSGPFRIPWLGRVSEMVNRK